MHLTNCLHPKTITNPYSREKMVVPCGKCESCRNLRSLYWVKRLEQERRDFKYCVFFTLTYNSKNLPFARLSASGDKLFNINHRSQEKEPLFIDISSLERKDVDYIKHYHGIAYLNKYDIQCFVKRCRINLTRLALKDYVTEKQILRYYIVGEIGPTNHRPHYHGLFFFNSKYTSTRIEEVIRSSWKYGIIDSSFVHNSAASYVAHYVNSAAVLPRIYENKAIKPFALFSKCPPIGTCKTSEKEVHQMFASCSPQQTVFDSQKRKFIDVPLLRTFKDALFPRISQFNRFSHADRVALYGIAQSACFCDESKEFVEWCKVKFDFTKLPFYSDICEDLYLNNISDKLIDYLRMSGYKSDHLDMLLRSISLNYMNENSLIRLWYISNKVLTNCSLFNVSLDTYVKHIEYFYENCDYENLKKQLKFEEDYSRERNLHDLLCLFPIDLDFANSKLDEWNNPICCDHPLYDLMEEFGVDFDYFLSLDLSERSSYIKSLLFNSLDYTEYEHLQLKIAKDSVKTKKKNDYLQKISEISKQDYYESIQRS